MNPPKKPSRPSTMMDTALDLPGEVLQKKLNASAQLTLEQLKEERERVEQYTKEQFARLSRLRELLREEKAVAEKEIEARRQELEQRLQQPVSAELQHQILQLKQQLQAALAERDATLKERQQASAQRDQLQLERDAAREQLRTLLQKNDAEALRKQAGELQEKLRLLTSERDAAVTRLTELQAGQAREVDQRLANLASERDAAQARLAELQAGHAESDSLRQVIAGFEQRMACSAEDLARSVQERDETQQQLAMARQVIKTLKEEQQRAAQVAPTPPAREAEDQKETHFGMAEWLDVKSAQDDADLLKRQVSEMQKKLSTTQVQLQRMRDQRQELQDLKAVRDLALVQVQQLVKELETQNSQGAESKRLEQELAVVRGEVEELRMQGGARTVEIDLLQHEIQRLRQEAGERAILEQQITHLQREAQQLRQHSGERAALERHITQLQQEAGKQSDEHMLLEQDVERLRRQLEALRSQRAEAASGPAPADVATLQRRLQEAEQELAQVQTEWAHQEGEMVAERRRLKEEQRQLAEDSKNLLLREHALREQLTLLSSSPSVNQ